MKKPPFAKRCAITALAFMVQLHCCALSAWANPSDPTVVSGQASFSGLGTSSLNITNTPGAIINWQAFSIGQNEITRFIQQSSQSAVLNRVVGGQMSELLGRLQSNGQIFLINPNGILVGPNAAIDTAGFFASTLQMLDADFAAGRLKLQGDGSSGSIQNQGWIRTGYGGFVVLVAPNVENSGLIEAPGGNILLAAGQKVTITSLDVDGVQFEIQAPEDSAINLGKLLADDGAVGIFAGTLQHSGIIRANALTRDEAGEIVLRASDSVEITASGSVHADGATGGDITIEAVNGTARVAGKVAALGRDGVGGNVDVLGDKVSLAEHALIDVSGTDGGGQIRVGGDYQGANPDVQNAASAYVGEDVTLRADATDSGDGGRIIVWADGYTRYFGSLSARGGPDGGNGGFAEVSGAGDLLFVGGADLGAPNGELGTLLLDPLDLFVDALGGINPYLFDELTDVPFNSVTVSPATLAAITGNVILYASRDLRINSAITLTGTGQGLTAEAGRDLQLGASITTSGGAVSLTALGTTSGGTLSTFAGSTIDTTGGGSPGAAVTLNAKTISSSLLGITAGTGAVNVNSSAGALSLGSIASAGATTLASVGGNLSTGSIVSSSTLSLNSAGGSLSTGSLTADGNTTLTSAFGISTGAILTDGGTLTATANDGSFTASGTIDTRPGQAGVTGAAVNITAQDSYIYYGYGYINTRAINTGNANVTLNGESITTNGFAIDTTGNVALTAATTDLFVNASIAAKINNAASVSAAASLGTSYNSATVSLSSDTDLNATSVTATAATCYNYSSCPGANITLSAVGDVNVGTVTASAPATFTNTAFYGATYADPRYENLNETVNVSSSAGSILAMSGTSLVTANDVTLSTIPGTLVATDGGIGTVGTALRVDVERNLVLKANGDFNVDLIGTGPNRLDVQLGVATTGQSYSGTLDGTGLNLDVSADDATVTVDLLDVTSGFDQRVFNQSPLISVYAVNGNLSVTDANLPAGDNTGSSTPAALYNCATFGGGYCPAAINYEALPVTLRAKADLEIANYMRTLGAQAKTTTFQSDDGSVTLDTIDAARDAVSVFADTGILLTDNLTTLGNVSMTNNISGDIEIGDTNGDELASNGSVTLTNWGGDVAIVRIDTTGGSGNVTINASSGSATVRAAIDSTAVEISSAGTIAITSNTIGDSTFGNPLDLAGNTVSLTTFGSDGGTLGDIGFSGAPVIANTTNLSVNASANFNVDTGSVDLKFLNVTADPLGVGAAGLAEVTTDGTTYEFVTDGTDFTLGDYTAPADQFASGGQLKFVATSGNVTINSIDFSASDGSFWVQTNGNLADITQAAAETIDLGAGFFTLRADGDVTLEAVNAGGLSASNATSNFGSGCLYIYYYSCGVQTFTANQTLTDSAWQAGTGGGGYWDVTSRGAIVTGDLDVGAVYFYSYSGGITTGTIGTAAAEASDVTLYAEYPYDAIVTDAIEADSLYISGSTITVNGDINAVNTDADSVSLYAETDITTGDVNASSVYVQAGGVLTFGDINATATDPSDITMYTYSSSATVTTGSLDADSITISNYYISSRPETITINGGIGDNSPGTDVTLYAGGISINGDVTLDPGSEGSVYLYADNAALDILGGDISAGDGSSIALYANHESLPFAFDTIDAGATGSVSITSPEGILQTLAGGSGGGITAQTVELGATATGAAIEGTSPLYLYDTTDLTIHSAGDLDVLLDGTTLEALYITRSDSAASWSLAGFAGGQSLAVATTGSGVDIDLSSSTALDFTYYNYDGTLGDVENANGIDTGGGWVDLYASDNLSNAGGIVTQGGGITLVATGALDTGAIDSSDGNIYLQAGNGLLVSDDVDAGAGGITVYADEILASSGAQLISTSSVYVSAWSGDIGASGTPLEVVAPTVSLYSLADVWADLTGTTGLTLSATNGFDVSSNVNLTSLYLHTSAGGMGSVNLTTATQTFDFDRDSFITPTTFLVHDVDSGTALTSVNINISGDMTVDGSIDANALTLTASGGTLELDGIGSALMLSNSSQTFSADDIVIAGDVNVDATGSQSLFANNSIDFTGFGGLSAGTSQNISTSSSGTAITFQADGGAIDLSAASQTISGGSATTISFLGGDAAGESVTVSASSTQNINAHDNIASNIVLEGGSGADSSVSIVYSGTGTQFVQGGNIAITGGAGTDAHAEITTASGAQRIRATGDIVLTGGDAAGAEARIVSTSTLEQRVGETQYIPFVGPEPYQTDNVILQGGNGAGALISATDGLQKIQANLDVRLLGGDGVAGAARIVKTGTANDQRIGCQSYWFFENCNQNLNTLILTAGTNGAFAELETASTQYIYATSSMSLTGSADDAGYALVEKSGASGSQNIYGGTTTMTAGAGDGSDVSLVSGTSQSLVFSGLTMNAGGTAGTDSATARIEAVGSQSLSASTTVLNGGAGDDSTASIESTGGSQNLFFSSLAMTGGSGANADAFLRSSTGQTLDGGNFTLAGGTGAGSEAFIDAGTTQYFNFIGSLSLTGGNAAGASAWIEGDSQQVYAGAISLTGGTGTLGNASDALIVNRSGNQIVQGSGAMTLTGGADYSTVAIRNEAAGGTQSIQASSITQQTQAGANNATNVAIENLAATAQTVNATSSGIRLVNDHSDGTVKIQSAATQDFNAAFLDISTGAGSDGDAAVIAAGDQEVHTFNGLLNADGSLRVVALGGGSAGLTSGGVQLLEIDYPELMQATRDGRITVGDGAALGTSSITAVDQHIFAKSIAVLGGSAPGSDSEISASDEQYISTLRGGLDVIGGAGGNAAIDPLIQVIVINGDANIQGGSGSGVTGSILSDGGQVILLTLGDLNVSGGSASNTFGQIITTGLTQTIGSVGNINLIPGSGTNADAIIAVGSGSGQSLLACLNCDSIFLPTLTSNPFSNSTSQFGVFGNPFFVTLADLSTVPGGVGEDLFFFDSIGELLALLEDSDELLDELEEDGIDLLDLRRMRICR